MPEDLYRVGDATVDGSALGFTLIVSVVATLFFGLAPAVQVSRLPLVENLREGGRGATSARGKRLRSVLVVAQVAATLVLLVGATQAIQALMRMQRVDPGFEADRVLTLGVRPSGVRYEEPEQRVAYQREVIEQIGRLSDVEAVGAVTYLPLDFSYSVVGFEVEGRQPTSSDEELFANENFVTPDYFAAIGVPLLRGRTFNTSDTREAPQVIAVNQTMADRFWPGEDPLGRRVRLDPDEAGADWATVVAVVGDVKHRWLTDDVWPQVYTPQSQRTSRGVRLVVRTSGDPAALTARVREAIWAVDPAVPVRNVATMNEIVAQSLGPIQIISALLTAFGALALLLACLGIYGVVAYAVSRRVSEFGVRMALGAETSDVLRLVMRQGALLAGSGALIGLVIAIALTRVASSALAGVEAAGLGWLLLAVLPLAAAALTASYLPARRAARVDPVTALRRE
jgi:putative ABC transport system permease protein